ncbi:class I SAM-dependent methyltransferase [Candidatus Neomarinimicrobiota bacterium]
MVFQFHRESSRQFEQQQLVTKDAIIPFIEEVFPIREGLPVMEIGCGEGGVLKSLMERGCVGTGVEINEQRYARAQHYLQEYLQQGQATLVRNDIFSVGFEKDFEDRFQLIVLKDVIEHLPDQERLLQRLGQLLQPGGAIFLSFPPWQMPFGGHQQVCRSKVLSLAPYFHLLPTSIYRSILKIFNEPEGKIEQLLDIKRTGISLEKFERLVQQTGYRTIQRTLFLINPIYRYKFGLKPRRQFKLITGLPFVRNFLTTGCYYLLKPDSS